MVKVAEISSIDHVRNVHRAAQRTVEMVKRRQLKRDDVDMVDLFFGSSGVDPRIGRYGMLEDPALRLDELAEACSEAMDWAFRTVSDEEQIAKLEAVLLRRFAQARRDAKPMFAVNSQGRPSGVVSERSRKSKERGDRATARIAAVYLIERAMYIGFSRRLFAIVADHMKGDPDRLLPHGAIKIGERANKIERAMRRALRAEKRVVSDDPSEEDVDDEVDGVDDRDDVADSADGS